MHLVERPRVPAFASPICALLAQPLLTALTSCEPVVNGIPRACYAIDEAAYRAAIASGAASGTGTVNEAGVASLSASGTKHCGRYRGWLGPKPCIRPVDFVIKYTVADGSIRFVRVPAGVAHRFNVNARPTPCELIIDDGAKS